MNIFGRLSRIGRTTLAGKQVEPLLHHVEKHRKAVLAHAMAAPTHAYDDCRIRLENLLAGLGGESLDINLVAADHRCPLGEWLYGAAGLRFSDLPEYRALRQSHLDFHLMTGDIVRETLVGNTDAARKIMRVFFRQNSGRVQTSLVKLSARCGCEQLNALLNDPAYQQSAPALPGGLQQNNRGKREPLDAGVVFCCA